MKKEMFPLQIKFKLLPRRDSRFQVVSKIYDNTYKIKLPGDYGVSVTFNVSNSSLFDVGDDEVNSRSNSVQEGEDEEDMENKDLNEVIQNLKGPMTRGGKKGYGSPGQSTYSPKYGRWGWDFVPSPTKVCPAKARHLPKAVVRQSSPRLFVQPVPS